MALTGTDHRRMLDFADEMRTELNAMASQQSAYSTTVDGPDGPELEWMRRERSLLHTMVNTRRAAMAYTPVTETDVYAIERGAAGHSDYAHRLTLRLAQLAYGQEWTP